MPLPVSIYEKKIALELRTQTKWNFGTHLREGNANVSCFESATVIRTITAHGNYIIELLQAHNDLTFLLWAEASKNRSSCDNSRDEVRIILLYGIPCMAV